MMSLLGHCHGEKRSDKIQRMISLILNQLLNYFNKQKILQTSRKMGGERYVKSFNAWCHLTVMLYAVIMRFDSLREIETTMITEVRKLHHVG